MSGRSGGGASTNGAGAPGLDREPSHPLVRRLWRALRDQAERDLVQDLRVAVMLADELPRERVADRLGLSRPEVEQSIARLERVVEAIRRDDETAPAMERSGVTT